MRSRRLLLLTSLCLVASIGGSRAHRQVSLALGGGDHPGPDPINQFYVTPDGIILMFPNPDEFGAMAPARSTSGHAPLASMPAKDSPAVVLYTIEDHGPRELLRIDSDALEVSDSFVASDGGSSIWVVWCEDRRAIKMAHVLDGVVVEVSSVSRPDEIASKPSVARGGYVSYQRLAGTQVEVVFAERSGSEWSRQAVAAIPLETLTPGADVHVQVHALDGTVWVDWVPTVGTMGYAFREPSGLGWSDPAVVPYSWTMSGDAEYTAREMARVAVRQLVLGGRARSQN